MNLSSWFHVSCAINEGNLQPSKNRNAKTSSHLLLCTDHFNGNSNSSSTATSKKHASEKKQAASTSKPSPPLKQSTISKRSHTGDLRDWEAAREEKKRIQQRDQDAADKQKRKIAELNTGTASDEEKQNHQNDGNNKRLKKAKPEVFDSDDGESSDSFLETSSTAATTTTVIKKDDHQSLNSPFFGQSKPASTSSRPGSATVAAPPKLLSNVGAPKRSVDLSAAPVTSGNVKSAPLSRPSQNRPRDMSINNANSNETPNEVISRVIRTQERLSQDLKAMLPNIQKPVFQKSVPVSSSTSILDSLLDKAHDTTELSALKREIETLKSKLALQDTTLISLRSNLVLIFNQLKLSTVTPDESSIDEYVAAIRDLMKS
ncbi:hypothetical protein HK100_001898 [Physocladia obscura]|uniref:Uncharacterized protein n=1 Tax=Physocladia obscura TaxID=109957 RepID=A0AAD5T267_9FUNG|nr:hypothetical protein HK100_001898 [Physocladia obscura]